MSRLSVVTVIGFMAATTGCNDDETSLIQPSLAYVGAEACSYCHTDTYNEMLKSGHPFKLTKVEDGQAPTYPFSTVPNPPAGYDWSDITYVIGGFGWKARFLGKDGYIITKGGNNQYNLANQSFADYHKDELKPYDCGRCHTTGYTPDGNQDGLPGIVGQWAEPGITCEECHGPGSLHVATPQDVGMLIDTRPEACGRCHNRGGLNAKIPASKGFIRHHEQYNEMQSTSMRHLNCVTCHDPHTGVRYNDQEGAQAIRLDCEDCHTTARASLQNAPLAARKADAICTDCHMPKASKSAVAISLYVGDVKTHIFAINPDSLAKTFTGAGDFANPYVTTEFACLPCHPARSKVWAAANASDIHGASWGATRPVAPAESAGSR